MRFLPPSRALLLTESRRRGVRRRQRELGGVLDLLYLLRSCQGVCFELTRPTVTFWVECLKHTHMFSLQMYSYSLSPSSVTHSPGRRACADLAVADLLPWSVKAKFHTKISCTFHATNKKCPAPPKKSLQLHVYQSRGCFILFSFYTETLLFLRAFLSDINN